MTKLDIGELNRLYSDSDSIDQELFAEQRSNLLLVQGNHYHKKNSRFWNRIRDSKDLSQEQKLRITKNHIQRITKHYVNSTVSLAPGVAIKAKNESELQDQKAAELHSAVYADLKQRHKMKQKIRQWVEDYINIGECAVKVFWDPNQGKIVGYEPEVDESGFPVIDPMTGQVMQSDRPIFSGDVVFERIYAFNLLRSTDAKTMDESHYLIYRKMVAVEDLKKMVGNDEKKLKYINESQDDTYTVFDASQGSYRNVKDQTMVREFYFRPCMQYPKGWYAITTSEGILFEGELPQGIFPIHWVGFDEVATCPRATSIVKVLRPYQAEINRAASKVAEHQVALGEDKLMIQDGATLSQGATLPGLRVVKYSGAMPQILPGRTGDSFIGYIGNQIEEMYAASNMAEEDEQLPAQLDPYAMLFRSMRSKKKFSLYAEKFEQFLIDVTETALKLCKENMSESMLVPAIGRKEFINIAEFKSSDDLSYQIQLESGGGQEPEEKLGRTLVMQHVIQYLGNKLEKDDIGLIMRSMPYANNEQAFSRLTQDYDNVKNDILALDRGEYRPSHPHDNHKYIIGMLIHRMKQSDFQFLQPMVQQLYQQKLDEHTQAEADQARKVLAAQADFIPAQGFGVPCDIYVSDPENPNKTKRARVPYDALAWLIQRLKDQGSMMEDLKNMGTSAQLEVAQKVQSPQQNAPRPGGFKDVPDPIAPASESQGAMNSQMASGL